MKRFLTAILAASAFVAASSCSSQEEEPAAAKISVKECSLSIPSAGGSATIEFVTDYAYDVEVDKSWCTVSVDGNVATFTADANESYESRYAGVTVKCEGSALSFTIQQYGFYSNGFAPADISASSKAASYDFPYESEETLTATTDADWITVTVTPGNLNVSLSENLTVESDDSQSRTAEVKWKLGHDTGAISVVQRDKSFMSVDANWTVRYGGQQNYNGTPCTFIYTDVANASLSGKYFITYVKKSEFTESGESEMDYFAKTVAEEARTEIESLVAYYRENGYADITFSDFLFEESEYQVFKLLADGDYIGFAIGFADDESVTGHYAYSEFTVGSGSGGGGGTETGYDSWLGQWSVTRGSETDTWTIAKQTEGESYTITGIEGADIPVAAFYESGYLALYAQEGLATVSTQNYGDCTVGIYGSWGDSNFATGNYPIFKGTISGSTATLYPETVTFEDGSSYVLERFMFVGESAKGQYLRFSKDVTPLPITITKISGGSDNPGGGDNPGTGSDSYNKWIGNWSVDSGAFTIRLSQNTADKTYNMRGWQIDKDYISPLPVVFNSADGTITLYGSDAEPIATNVDIGVEEGACNLYYIGKFVYSDGKEYFITAGGEGWYDVATGTFQSDGSVKFTGNSFKVSTGGEFTFCKFELAAIPISAPDSGVYTFKSSPNNFPLTAVKAGSTSSVKTSGLKSGVWEKSDVRWIGEKPSFVEVQSLCTPRRALPEMPMAFRFNK